MCKISLWSVEYVMNKSITNLIEFQILSKYRRWDGRQLATLDGMVQCDTTPYLSTGRK